MNNSIATIKAIQGLLGVTQDGIFGPKSRSALDDLIAGAQAKHSGLASSFADPKDVSAFKKCKAQGKSDEECFRIGDNGVGFWGDSTVEGTGASCALTKEDIVARWGSLGVGRRKPVLVSKGDKQVVAILKDIKGHMNEVIIDLNPDACNSLGIAIPAMTPVFWEWV